MKLYVTPGSPYARMARIVVMEKRLESRVEVIFAKTRIAGSPYYQINPSGRVPYLVRDDGVGLEESALICAWFDQLDGRPGFGLPADERSPGVIRHEIDRASRMLDLWEREVEHPYLRGALNMAQLALACALGLEARNPHFDWRSGHPRLLDWYGPLAARASFAATSPPAETKVN